MSGNGLVLFSFVLPRVLGSVPWPLSSSGFPILGGRARARAVPLSLTPRGRRGAHASGSGSALVWLWLVRWDGVHMTVCLCGPHVGPRNDAFIAP